MINWWAISGIIAMAPPGGEQGSGGMGTFWVPLALMMVAFYFLLIMPERKRKAEREKLLKELQRGDEILTAGGIYGKITALNDDQVTVEIAPNVRIKVGRQFVSTVSKGENALKEKEKDKDKGKDKDPGEKDSSKDKEKGKKEK